jgi:hypothetical protein
VYALGLFVPLLLEFGPLPDHYHNEPAMSDTESNFGGSFRSGEQAGSSATVYDQNFTVGASLRGSAVSVGKEPMLGADHVDSAYPPPIGNGLYLYNNGKRY